MQRNSKISLKTIIIMGLLIALSAVGANIKVFSSIAFDSMPAFFGALILGPVAGGIIGFIGHILTSYLSGFPMTLPVHLIIAVMMFVTCYVFGVLNKELFFTKAVNLIIAVVIAVLLNGPIELVIVSFYMQAALGMPFMAIFGPYIVPLSLAAALNVVIAGIVYKAVEVPLKRYAL